MAADQLLSLVVVTRLLSLFLGATIAWLAYRGYLRNRTRWLLFLALGLSFVTLGTFIEGVLFEFLGLEINQIHAVESTLNVIGFLLILFSVRSS